MLQWPSATKSEAQEIFSRLESEQIIDTSGVRDDIEQYFSLFSNPALLVPSARSGLSQYLRALDFNREHQVFISRFNSHCMFTSLGAITNITTDLNSPNAFIVNHKWGYLNRIESGRRLGNSGGGLFFSRIPVIV